MSLHTCFWKQKGAGSEADLSPPPLGLLSSPLRSPGTRQPLPGCPGCRSRSSRTTAQRCGRGRSLTCTVARQESRAARSGARTVSADTLHCSCSGHAALGRASARGALPAEPCGGGPSARGGGAAGSAGALGGPGGAPAGQRRRARQLGDTGPRRTGTQSPGSAAPSTAAAGAGPQLPADPGRERPRELGPEPQGEAGQGEGQAGPRGADLGVPPREGRGPGG